MPKVGTSYGGQVIYTDYENLDESPNNVKLFIRQLSRLGLSDGLEFYNYRVKEDTEENTKETDLDLIFSMDSEKFAKDEYPNLDDVERRADSYALTLGIDSYYISKKFVNKKEFAEKFLKDLKKHLKTLDVGGLIHQIRFDVLNQREMEIKVIKKNIWLSGYSDREIRDEIKDYLLSMGYPKIKVYIA